jgi:hypothetical protein
MNITENTKVKEWYMTEYPDDELGEEMNQDVTFYDLFVVLDTYKSVYDTLNVWDSIIRERVFSKLAEIMNVDYDYIYEQWLKG